MAVKPLRATLPDLSSPQGRPCLAGVANYTPLARQRIATFPLPLTKAWHRIPSHYLPVSLEPAICGLSSSHPRDIFLRFLQYILIYLLPPLVVSSRSRRIPSDTTSSSKEPSLNKCATPTLTNDGWTVPRPSFSAMPL
jgi:hypothetical protein